MINANLQTAGVTCAKITNVKALILMQNFGKRSTFRSESKPKQAEYRKSVILI